MASQFTCFSWLPPELRRLIWKACKPTTRVMEFNVPSQDLLGPGERGCRLRATSNRNGRLPAFSRVCLEACEVAYEEGCFIWDMVELSGLRGTAKKDVFNHWFYHHTDIIHLNFGGHGSLQTEDARSSMITTFLALKPKAKSISLTLRLFQEYGLGIYHDDRGGLFQYLQTQQEYLVTLRMINIHVTDEQAIASGLFEYLEAPVQLIDIEDHKTIRRMHLLWQQSHIKDSGTGQYMADCYNILDPEIYAWARRTALRQTMEYEWLLLQYNEACKDGSLQMAYMKNEMFIGPPVDMYFDTSHHWVKGALADMPRIRPMIMFRHCSDKCN